MPHTKWGCDFCSASFDTRDEALEHEGHCDARLRVRLSYQYGKKLGLVLLGGEDDTELYPDLGAKSLRVRAEIFRRSIVFVFADQIRSATNSLFFPDCESNSYSGWEVMADECLEGLIDFGQKNIVPEQFRDGPVHLNTINDESLKAVLTGKIRPADILLAIEHSSEESLSSLSSLYENSPLSTFAALVLRRKECYPVTLTLKRNTDDDYSTASESDDDFTATMKSSLLDLADNIIVRHLDWNVFKNGLSQWESLEKLKLDGNNIGPAGCASLASLLERSDLSLKSLSLKRNLIDDECVFILVEALKHNHALKALYLNENAGITDAGQKGIIDLLCDKTTIQSTYMSNHTLKHVGLDHSVHSREMARILTINSIPTSRIPTSRSKIMDVHFSGEPFDLQPLLPIQIEIMPWILLWFGEKSHWSHIHRFRHLNHIVRNWNIPALFRFPSQESLRIGSRIKELEAKNAHLENIVMKLRSEISNSNQEKCGLRSNEEGELKESSVLKMRDRAFSKTSLRYPKRRRK